MQRLFLSLAVVLLGCSARAFAAESPHAGDEYRTHGFELNKAGKCREAIPYLSKAIELDATNCNAYIERGFAWYALGQYDKAIADANEALRLNPQHATVYNNRGWAWYKSGDYAKALADFNQSLTIDPKYADPYDALALVQATCPNEKYRDGKKAFENASKAYQLSDGKQWNYIATLAAAYAECRDFDAAREWQAKAIDLALANKSVTDANKAELRARLELYKQEKPYRAAPQKQQ